MATLVVGASGATGRHLVEQLLIAKQKVKVIVRSPEKLPESWKANDQLTIIQASISEITVDQMAEYLRECTAVASCLGHNISFKGLFGKPRKLVADAVELLCKAIEKNQPDKPVRFVLMNTSGNQNRDLNEPISTIQKVIVAIIRWVLPPHSDNEAAADYLRVKVGQKSTFVEWVAVRPDGLVNENKVTEYSLFPSPIRSAIFNPGTVSRVNVGHFMAMLITDIDLWEKWKGQMPVIYGADQKKNLPK